VKYGINIVPLLREFRFIITRMLKKKKTKNTRTCTVLLGLHIDFSVEFTVTVHNTAFGLSTRSATSVGRVTVSLHGLRHQKY